MSTGEFARLEQLALEAGFSKNWLAGWMADARFYKFIAAVQADARKRPAPAMPKLTSAQRELFKSVVECDGFELHKGQWRIAEGLAKKELVTMSGARGPSREWRRVELTALGRVCAERRS